jgi:hypothetical protein
MFAKDYHLLNEIYTHKVITEDTVDYNAVDADGLGQIASDHRTQIKDFKPPVRGCSCGCGGSCGNANPEEDCESCYMDDEACETCEGEMGIPGGEEHENADMAKQSLYRLVKLSAMLHDLIEGSEHIEPWVLAKIVEAQKGIESVYGYQDYQVFKNKVDSDLENIEEETEHDLYNSISSGGGSLLSVLKKLLATESKDVIENVLYETITALEAKK